VRIVIRLLPSFTALGWLFWYSVQARWSKVIVPNIGWLLLGTVIMSGVAWWLTRKREKTTALTKREEAVIPKERLLAKETYTWRTVTRERSIYAKPK